jgi:hypothetical protein
VLADSGSQLFEQSRIGADNIAAIEYVVIAFEISHKSA